MPPRPRRSVLSRCIEQASLRAWPALEEERLEGWTLRFSRGYTRRANSVIPAGPLPANPEVRVAACEARYAARGLPAVFRLTSLGADPELDRVLEGRGYREIDPTGVLHRPLDDSASEASASLTELDADAWLARFACFHATPPERHATHAEIVRSIRFPCLFASVAVDGEPAACGLGVLDGECFGLFDLVTAPERRGRGLGTALVVGMLARARERGASTRG
ncbi:MAG TPA: GNAT family N-acetyltransferase [Longimicrobiaceae bacterium]|nr:GNAT family N-acetyltransferase [Longimicrobiaceae bacterium]